MCGGVPVDSELVYRAFCQHFGNRSIDRIEKGPDASRASKSVALRQIMSQGAACVSVENQGDPNSATTPLARIPLTSIPAGVLMS